MTDQGRSILLVDDDEDICANMADIFADLGYAVDVAHEGAEALEFVGRRLYDVALVDMKMPGMDGVTLCREIQRVRPGMVSLLVTAYAGADTAREALDAGAWRVVPKPVDFPKLMSLVDDVIGQPLLEDLGQPVGRRQRSIAATELRSQDIPDPVGPSILIVEDDVDTRANLRDILELDDYQVDEAATVAEALKGRDWSRYLAILLDRRLPDGTAADLLSRLPRLAPTSAVIVVTGHADVGGAIEALRQGAVDYLLKPINPSELRARLRRIAEHRRLEKAHQESERFARSVLDSLAAHIAVLDHSGTILAVNQAWRDFAAANGAGGVNVSVGADYFQACVKVSGEDAETARAFTAGIHDVLAGWRAIFELEYACHAPHQRRWFVARVTPFQGDRNRRVVVAHTEITERMLAEEALRRTEQRFRSLVQNSSDIITMLTGDGSIVYQSPSIERVLGHQPEDRVGTNVFLDPIVHPDDLGKKRAFLDQAKQRPGELVSAEFRLRHGDGTWRTIEAVGQNLLSDPNVAAIITNYRDISERVEAQARVLQSERLAAIGEMITALAHESRNALQRGHACLEMLALEVPDRPRAKDLVARIERALDELRCLYEDVRNYAAPIQLECSACDLVEVWRAAWADLEPVRQGRAAVLRELIEAVDCRCLIDPFRMGQVFRNLLENALAACSDPVEITIRCEPDQLEGRSSLRTIVRDNGPGFTPQQGSNVFKAFYTTKTKGTGLGLAICRRIVEAHGGRIELGETAGTGAEFRLNVPRGNSRAARFCQRSWHTGGSYGK